MDLGMRRGILSANFR